MEYRILILLLVSFISHSYGQTFNNSYYFEGETEDVTNIVELNGSYLLFGKTINGDLLQNHSAIFLSKVDYGGVLIDTVLLRDDSTVITIGSFFQNMNANLLTDKYLIVGRGSNFLESTQNGYILCLDNNFNVVWQKKYGGVEDDYIYNYILNNEYFIFGTTNSFSNDTVSDIWMFKIDTLGNVLLDTVYGGNDRDYMATSILLDDGTMVLSGATDSYTNMHPYFLGKATNGYFIKIDQQGSVLWDKVIEGEGFDSAPILSGNGFFTHRLEVPLDFFENNYINYFGQLDIETGDILWQHTINIEEIIIGTPLAKKMNNGDYMIFCQIEHPDYFYGLSKLIRYDSNREILWERTYYSGDIYGNKLNDFIEDSEDYLVFTGTVGDIERNSFDMWLLKLDQNGCLDEENCGLMTSIVDLTIGRDTFGIAIFPNPAKDKATIIIENTALYKGEYVDMSIYDSQGKQVYLERFFINGALPQMEVDVSTYASGIYNVQVCVDGKECGTNQLMVE